MTTVPKPKTHADHVEELRQAFKELTVELTQVRRDPVEGKALLVLSGLQEFLRLSWYKKVFMPEMYSEGYHQAMLDVSQFVQREQRKVGLSR